MATIIGKILGREVKVQNMPKKMVFKVLRAAGIRSVIRRSYAIISAMPKAISLPNVVKRTTGREAEEFETIALRYIAGDPVAPQTLGNKISNPSIFYSNRGSQHAD